MSAGAQAVAAFEVLRFEAVPAEAGVAVLVLAGRFAGGHPGRVPRLLVEQRGREREVAPVQVDASGAELRAVFAVPLDVLEGPETGFALVPARGPLIALPAPTAATGPDPDRYVRMARTTNELRRRLADAEARAAAAEDHAAQAEERAAGAERRAGSAAAESEHLIAGLREEVTRREAAARAASADALAAAERERDELRARLAAAEDRAGRFESDAVDALALVRRLEQRAAAAEAETRAVLAKRPVAAPPPEREEPTVVTQPTAAPDPTDPVPIAVRRPLRPVPAGPADEVLEPAQVGARTIRPAGTTPPPTLLPRLLAVGALALLLLALVLIVVTAL